MDYRTPLSRVRGLGSVKAGSHHWWMQRITAVALIPLSLVAISLLNSLFNDSYAQTVAWLASPLNSTLIVAWLLAVFYHSALGLQVVIEDYVAAEGAKIAAIWSVNLIFFLLALAGVLAVLRTISVG
ncbi:MAG: succinate dehydrogenase, hydrophobic membrane anchor protein [Methylococcales bacterium]|nr:succinate dehydrogenase, hydrophobic membrane anchor protein [Methylococcales bacterium]MDP3837714.1 succinate dehydrogenase, hydrophobic membrane anchor protein [Methylococcales bacterium]